MIMNWDQLIEESNLYHAEYSKIAAGMRKPRPKKPFDEVNRKSESVRGRLRLLAKLGRKPPVAKMSVAEMRLGKPSHRPLLDSRLIEGILDLYSNGRPDCDPRWADTGLTSGLKNIGGATFE